MTEALTLISICVLDWGYAIRAMAYDTQLVWEPGDEDPQWRGPKWHDWYEHKHFGQDRFHIVGWIRYPALTWLAWLGFGEQWWLYALTAAVNSAGWAVGKIIHRKDKQWGLLPAWLRRKK